MVGPHSFFRLATELIHLLFAAQASAPLRFKGDDFLHADVESYLWRLALASSHGPSSSLNSTASGAAREGCR